MDDDPTILEPLAGGQALVTQMARARGGLTVRQLAALSGVKPATVGYVRGGGGIRIEWAIRIADVLDVPTSALFQRRGGRPL